MLSLKISPFLLDIHPPNTFFSHPLNTTYKNHFLLLIAKKGTITMSTTTPDNVTTPTPTDALEGETAPISLQRVQEVLDLVRPYLQSDGGDVDLIGVTPEGIVQLKLQGACGTCPSSTYTLKMGIEEQLRQHIPQVTGVEQVF
jgi:Fe-S cluster biogenesis protein NfuA